MPLFRLRPPLKEPFHFNNVIIKHSMDSKNTTTTEEVAGLTQDGRLPEGYVTPRLLEEFESHYRKEQLFQNKLNND